MSSDNRWDSVGWGFFGAMLVLWSFPSIYFVFSITSDSLTKGTRAGTGIVLAFFAASFTSWLVNSMLNYRAERRESREAPPANNDAKKKK